ncbi:MAG: family 20 glycosylhydrolase [Candidatus Omnitrophica bacterium]|nr:family 20 glycosylhydrolase [Candidatus Omnitrophota bacterium]
MKTEICPQKNSILESEKLKVFIGEDGNIISLLDKINNIEFVRWKNIFRKDGLQIWIKEGFVGRDPNGYLSHKFSEIIFAQSSIKKENSKIIIEKNKNDEKFEILYDLKDYLDILTTLKNLGERKFKQFEFFFSWEIPAGTNILVPGKNRYFRYIVPPFGRIITRYFKFYNKPIYIIRPDKNGIKIEFSELLRYVIYNRGKMCVVGGFTNIKRVDKNKSISENIKISLYKSKNIKKITEDDNFVLPGPLKNPYFKKRFIHISLYYKRVDLNNFFKIIKNLNRIGYNGVILGIGKGMKFESYPEISEEWSYSKKEMKEINDYIKSIGMEIIPEFPTLGHQNDTNLVKVDPEIVEDPKNPFVYCTSNPKTYQVIFSILEEIIDIFKPEIMHLTHDEVQHWFSKKRMGICNRCKNRKLWEIYSEDVNKLHSFLFKKNIRMSLWGDMLLDHRKFKICNCNGAVGDVYKAIDLIPKDIIIFDWHYHYYKKYPSLDYFLNKGFKVFPATSFFNPKAVASFCRYAKKIGLNDGVIETTWAVPVIEELPIENIFISSQIFQNPEINLNKIKNISLKFALYLYKEVKK